MFCPHCGTALSATARFCKVCGRAQPAAADPQTGVPGTSMLPPSPTRAKETLVGFSPRIQDPVFDRFRKKNQTWALLFAGILFVAATVGFPLYGNISGALDWPRSLYYGMGIGGLFVIIARMQTVHKGRDKTWDGTVVDKKAVRKQRYGNDGHSVSYDMQYTVVIRKDNERTKKHRMINQPGLYNYLRIGERVRHHKGFWVYEKYDKSKDAETMCIACAKMNSILADVCSRCKCPVLKG